MHGVWSHVPNGLHAGRGDSSRLFHDHRERIPLVNQTKLSVVQALVTSAAAARLTRVEDSTEIDNLVDLRHQRPRCVLRLPAVRCDGPRWVRQPEGYAAVAAAAGALDCVVPRRSLP